MWLLIPQIALGVPPVAPSVDTAPTGDTGDEDGTTTHADPIVGGQLAPPGAWPDLAAVGSG